MMPVFNPSPVQKISFRNRQIFVKRDDLLHPDFSGNKARKFLYYFNNLPQHIDTIASYGGNQSNAMFSLSAFAKLKKLKFNYYTRPIPFYLKQKPAGNFLAALNNGMNIIEINSPNEIPEEENTFFIKQGGAEPYAEVGLKQLAQEIDDFALKQNFSNLTIFLPSGTGATAVFLQKNSRFRVFTTPCVGNEDYLSQQFFELVPNKKNHPQILNLHKKFQFGRPYPEFLKIWTELTIQTNIEFDLLYDPPGWLALMRHFQILQEPVLYIHCGGTAGNQTMLSRYCYNKIGSYCK